MTRPSHKLTQAIIKSKQIFSLKCLTMLNHKIKIKTSKFIALIVILAAEITKIYTTYLVSSKYLIFLFRKVLLTHLPHFQAPCCFFQIQNCPITIERNLLVMYPSWSFASRAEPSWPFFFKRAEYELDFFKLSCIEFYFWKYSKGKERFFT